MAIVISKVEGVRVQKQQYLGSTVIRKRKAGFTLMFDWHMDLHLDFLQMINL